MTPSVSVVIPTYQGANRVVALLRDLEAQTKKEFETVVAIDGSDDGTEEKIRRSGVQLDSLKVATQPNRGRAGARNFGASLSAGTLLIFVDDDLRVPPDFIERHINFHQNNAQTILVGSAIENLAEAQTDFQKYKAGLSRKWLSAVPTLQPLSENQLFLAGANFSISSTNFNTLHGFDTALRDGEDHEFGRRAIQEGIPVVFNPEIAGWHPQVESCYHYINRLREYARGRSGTPIQPVYKKSLPQRLFYWVFSWQFWVRAIDQERLSGSIPRSVRYRIYDWVTTSLSQWYPAKALR